MDTHSPLPYKRVLLKISGEGLASDGEEPLDMPTILSLAEDIKAVMQQGVEVCLVTGGGNFFRGAKGYGNWLDRPAADTVGMLATLMNATALENVFSKKGVRVSLHSAVACVGVAEAFNRQKALDDLKNGRVVLFAGGIGLPYFTTDTAGALRAAQMECDAFFKATQVDGVYDKDPKKYPDVCFLKTVSYQKTLDENLKVMDRTAVEILQKNNIPAFVFNQHRANAFLSVIRGEGLYTMMNQTGEDK